MKESRGWVPVLGALIALVVSACGGGDRLIVGATTSLQDTGILDELLAAFEAETGIDATPVVAGSGQIIELARRGEVDVLITHSPDAEEALLEEGHVSERRRLMENRFLIVGPPADPAGIRGLSEPAAAMRRIAEAGAAFISRGDGSGTHAREMELWSQTGLDPRGQSWYQESAVGQGQSLVVAADKGAYTLVDSATYRVFQERISLIVYVEDRLFPNVYHAMLVDSQRHPQVRGEAARAFLDFLLSDGTRQLIADYGTARYGAPLFQVVQPGDSDVPPDAGSGRRDQED